MKPLAAWIMRGPAQASALIAAALLVGLVLPPFAWLSGAMLALVVLSAGSGAVRVLVPAAVVGAIGGLLAVGSPFSALLTAAASWAPVVLIAAVLRSTARLDLAVAAAAAIGWVVVLGIHALAADPAMLWEELLSAVVRPAEVAPEFDMGSERLVELIERIAPLMTALVAASTVTGALTALFLGRWWQALLYKPGGFREEFHRLRLGQTAALVVALLMALAAFTESPFVLGLALVGASVYLFQGLAVVHGVVALRGLHTAWLVGIYMLGVVLFLQMALALVVIGIADAWMDLRARAAGSSG